MVTGIENIAGGGLAGAVIFGVAKGSELLAAWMKNRGVSNSNGKVCSLHLDLNDKVTTIATRQEKVMEDLGEIKKDIKQLSAEVYKMQGVL